MEIRLTRLLAPTGQKHHHRDEERRSDNRPEEGKRGASHVDHERLGQPHPMRDPGTDHRPDETEDDRDQASAVRPAGDRAAERPGGRSDQEINEQGNESKVHTAG